MDKYRIKLHVGLPKTATTSLQRNVLYGAHLDGKINYLGRKGDRYDANYFNPFDVVYEKIVQKDLNNREVLLLRKTLFSLLREDQVNVISEECLSLTHQRAFVGVRNLSKLFKDCSVDVLVSLRSPIDFFLSYYAELYRWTFFSVKQYSTIEKFSLEMLNSPNDECYDILFFDRFLSKIRDIFPNIRILLFEDIVNDKGCYLEDLSSFLAIGKEYTEALFFRDKHNIRKTSATGKYSERVTLDQKLAFLFAGHSFANTKRKIKGYPLFYRLVNQFMRNIPVGRQVEHVLAGNLRKQMNDCLLLDEKFASTYSINKEKLLNYGYICS